MIDNLARAEDILWLEMRGGIRDLKLAVDAELVERAGAGALDRQRVPAVGAGLHRMAAIAQQLDTPGSRRPKPEGDVARRQKRTELGWDSHISPENTSTLREDATAFEPAAHSLPASILFTVSSTGSQRLYSGNVGRMNSISCAAAL